MKGTAQGGVGWGLDAPLLLPVPGTSWDLRTLGGLVIRSPHHSRTQPGAPGPWGCRTFAPTPSFWGKSLGWAPMKAADGRGPSPLPTQPGTVPPGVGSATLRRQIDTRRSVPLTAKLLTRGSTAPNPALHLSAPSQPLHTPGPGPVHGAVGPPPTNLIYSSVLPLVTPQWRLTWATAPMTCPPVPMAA